MATLSSSVYITLAVVTSYLMYGVVTQVPMPTIDLEEWWGPNSTINNTDTSIRNFTVNFTDSMITDLKFRLNNRRAFTPDLEGINFTYGFNHKQLETLLNYWADEYPFAERQDYLNKYPQYKVNIQGLDIHFLWIRAENPDNKTVLPLMLLHGYPGSVREFYEAIPYLTSLSEDKGYVLDLVVPSLPGFGFSDAAVRPGLGVDKAAVIFRNLMQTLGYQQYLLQAGDLGSLICGNMATFFPDEVLGFHSNFALFHTPEILFRLWYGSYYPDDIVTPDVASRIYPLIDLFLGIMIRTGYLHIQATKPDTIGVVVSDSPSFLVAYTIEKITNTFIYDTTKQMNVEQIFDNIMIYWANNAMNTAMRMYAETFNKRYLGLRTNEIVTQVPTCFLQCQNDIIFLPEPLLKLKFPNLLNETIFFEGGHYIAWELPQNYSQNVIDAIDRFVAWNIESED